jgi:16S rRNA (guanine966-N2)-methyltransferase
MRIVAGRFRGRRLAALGKGDPAAHLRPTADRVRESLFNVLSARMGFEGCRVLDLFAGTGALGLEALSRGAEAATFVDTGRAALRLIRDNIQRTGTGEITQVLARDATRLGAGAPHELIFLDPPYGKGLGEVALNSAVAGGWVSDTALIVWEERAPMPVPPGFEGVDQRRYGDTCITILARATAASP